MTDPLVSIHMITYNHAPYIGQAIEGVLKQKVNFPIELVIGEDCSTDRTREIVFEYQNKHPDIIRVITSDKNVGAKKNSYRTMKACRGKYIAFCEGDDYWHRPDKLQKQVDYLESHTECGLVYSNFDVYEIRSRKRVKDFIQYRKWPTPENPSISDFLEGRGEAILTCTVMLRRDLLEHIIESDTYLYTSGRFLRNDNQLWAEMATMCHLHYIPMSLATYNELGESATRSKDITKTIRLQIADAELGLYLCNKYGLPPVTMNRMHAKRWNGLLRLAFHTRQAELADQVRQQKKALTWKEWLMYYGAKSRVLHYVFGMGVLFRNLFGEDRNLRI